MDHRIMLEDTTELFFLIPYQNDGGKLTGFTLAIHTSIWNDFKSVDLLWKPEVIASLKHDWETIFYRLPKIPHSGQRFGFRRGIQIGELGTEWVTLRILLQKEARRGFSTALNLHWLLDFLFDSLGQTSTEDQTRQLFAVGTGIAIDPRIHGFAIWVTASKYCAGILEQIPEHTDFAEARRLIAELLRHYGIRTAQPGWMQAHVRNKGILQISAGGNCNCLGMNPDERMPSCGYSMFSHNTDNAVDQIALLIGLAQIWKELREKSQSMI